MVLGKTACSKRRSLVMQAFAFLAISIVLAACDNPLAKVVDVLKAETLSPRIAVLARGTDSLATGGEYDFGDVCVGDVVSVTLHIKNDGRRSLAIDVPNITLTMSSGSASGTFTRSGDVPATIEPGQSAIFTCSYAPSDTAARSVSLVIPTNDLVTPQYALTLKGKGFSIGFNASIISEIQTTTAKFTGEITNDYGSPILQRGICWSTSPYPTTNDSKVLDSGTGTGSFASVLTGMVPGQSYYARAFAVNALGTGYSSQIYFSTLPAAPAAPTVGPIGYPAGSGKLSVAWPAVSGKGVSYDVYYSVDGTRPATPNGPTGLSATSCTLTGLSDYTSYNVWIRAKNSSGDSAFSVSGTAMVGVRVTAINLSGKYSYFLEGMTETLTVEIFPETATSTTLTWASSTGDVTVANGIITGVAKGPGSATITATAADGSGVTGNYNVTTESFAINRVGPAGGNLFYDKGSYSEGWRYLEYAGTSASTYRAWATSTFAGVFVSGATSTALGAGKGNTDAIIELIGEGAALAYYCRNYSGGGFTDWYMPSLDEVDRLATNIDWYRDLHVASSTQYGSAVDRYIGYSYQASPRYDYRIKVYSTNTVPIRQF